MTSWMLVLLTQVASPAGLVQVQKKMPADAPTVYVHIDSNYPEAQLIRYTSLGVGTVATARGTATLHVSGVKEECDAPCEKNIEEPAGTFFVRAPGMTPSNLFTFKGKGENVSVTVRGGSSALKIAGFTSLAFGIPTALICGMLWGISAASSAPSSSVYNPYKTSSEGSVMSSFAMPCTLVGAGLTVIGIPLNMAGNTKVEVVSKEGAGGLGVKNQGGEL